MSHELTITNGIAEMAYVGATPWHGLGQQLPEGASIEEWQTAAGMDWTIASAPVQYVANGITRPAPSKVVLYRSDNGHALGVVSPKYQPVNPHEVLEFFRDLTTDAGMSLHTAGTLFGGTRMWALAKFATDQINADDEVGGFILLSTASDGTMATEARETTVRVVCNNTLSMARQGSKTGVIKVGHRTKFDAVAVKAELTASSSNFAAVMETSRRLASVRITASAANDFVRNLLRPVETDSEKTPKGEALILDLFRGRGMGSSLNGSDGTAWGLVNAVTEYVDHHATAKSGSHRMSSAWFGAGDDLKSRAFELAQAF